MKQLVVASEYGEPSKHEDIICQRLSEKKDICLLLITKNLPGCSSILRAVKQLEIPLQIHCTITGLGGTKLEPQIPAPNPMVKDSLETIRRYQIEPEAVTLRIDPIIPDFSSLQLEIACSTLDLFSCIGVRDCRVSIVDYYPHVRERFDRLGIYHPNSFQPSSTTKKFIIDQMFHLTHKFNMRLHLCAESIPLDLSSSTGTSIDTGGCASKESWERIGITDLKPIVRSQRKECTCDLKKEDLLAGLSKGCKGGCIYCYWRS